jgi:hypothetical protein
MSVRRILRGAVWVALGVMVLPICAVWDLLDLTQPVSERTEALRSYWELLADG